MKLRAPPACTVVSHAGGIYPVKADGSLDVDDDVAAALIAHGFMPWARQVKPEGPRAGCEVAHNSENEAPNIDDLNRPALFAFLREQGVRVSLPITNEELRALARHTLSSNG